MDGLELVVMIGSGIVALAMWVRLIAHASSVAATHSPAVLRAGLWLGPLAACVLVFGVLRSLASFDVLDSATYLSFYLVLGLAWISIPAGTTWTGISARDDVIERGNAAALVAWTGVIVGTAACYACANVGDGPGFYCVLWAGGLATMGFALSWGVLHRVSRIADHVTIDRDLASGIRAASFMAAAGVIWGRGGAGDWTSATKTVVELGAAWPVVFLLAKAVVVERLVAQRPQGAVPSRGGGGYG